MAEITAKMIQELREKTAAGMMDCGFFAAQIRKAAFV